MSVTDEHHGQLYPAYPYTFRPEVHKALMTRGIDYWVMQGITFWNRDDGCECLAYGYKANGVQKLAIKVVGFTDPEQAVAATLGTGTCKPLPFPERHGEVGDYEEFWEPACKCSECGELIPMRNYCPNCGARIEEDE